MLLCSIFLMKVGVAVKCKEASAECAAEERNKLPSPGSQDAVG